MKDWKALGGTKTLLVPMNENEKMNEILVEKLGCEVEIDCSKGAMTTVFTLKKLPMEKIIFVGVGNGEYKEAFMKAGSAIKEDVAVYVNKENAYLIALGLELGMYSYKKKEVVHVEWSGCEEEVQEGLELARCINEAKYWSDMPSNLLTPETFKEEAIRVAKTNGLEIEVLQNAQLERMHAGGILAVGAGSKYPAYMVTLKYNGNGDAPYIGLVGKGLCYDAGGYSIKKKMVGMKFDMCGAANVIQTISYISKKKMKVNVIATVGMTQNMLDANSYSVDDVLTMMNGKTVEITNTDAEGRLVLADCLTYIQKNNLCCLFDMATLTGACANALGPNYSGAFTNSEKLFEQLKEASKETKERVWQMPLDEDFHAVVRKSNVADMTNCQPGTPGGASLAAAFLEEFIENNTPWIHLDIAGTSLFENAGSGVMIQTLSKFIENQQ